MLRMMCTKPACKKMGTMNLQLEIQLLSPVDKIIQTGTIDLVSHYEGHQNRIAYPMCTVGQGGWPCHSDLEKMSVKVIAITI